MPFSGDASSPLDPLRLLYDLSRDMGDVKSSLSSIDTTHASLLEAFKEQKQDLKELKQAVDQAEAAIADTRKDLQSERSGREQLSTRMDTLEGKMVAMENTIDNPDEKKYLRTEELVSLRRQLEGSTLRWRNLATNWPTIIISVFSLLLTTIGLILAHLHL